MINPDKVGAAASLGCAIHCACMPLLLIILPVISASFFASDVFEWILFALTCCFGIGSLSIGYRKHKSVKAFIIMTLSLLCILAGRLTHDTPKYHTASIMLLVCGGLGAATGHFTNHRMCHCRHESCKSS